VKGGIEFLFNFSNERFFFTQVDHRVKFTLIGVQRGIESDGFWATFRFNPRIAVAPDELFPFLSKLENLIYVYQKSLKRFSPDSLSLMEFQTQEDYDIAEKIYGDWPLIGEEIPNSWQVRFTQELNMTTDRNLFNAQRQGFPLYEGKMINQFDSYYAPPQFWVEEAKAKKHFAKKQLLNSDDFERPRLGFREIARPTDIRTLIAAIIPPNTCCNHKIFIGTPKLSTYTNSEMLYALTILNSLVLDYIARFKITTSMSLFHLYQLPMPRLTVGKSYFDAIVPRAARLTCTTPAFADLWQEVMGTPWQESLAATDPGERQRLRDELDAIVAHLYGLTRDEFAHILGTFPLVFPNDAAGEQKKAALTAVYDAFAYLRQS
jgi:hypothetical protein